LVNLAFKILGVFVVAQQTLAVLSELGVLGGEKLLALF